GPSRSTSAGRTICGLTARYFASRWAPFIRLTSITSSGARPLRLSAMRTRYVASERQNENSFTAPALPINCGRIIPTIICQAYRWIAPQLGPARVALSYWRKWGKPDLRGQARQRQPQFSAPEAGTATVTPQLRRSGEVCDRGTVR